MSSTNSNAQGSSGSNNTNNNNAGFLMNSNHPQPYSSISNQFYSKIESFTNFDSIIEYTPKKSNNQNNFPLIMNSSHLFKNEKENSFMKGHQNFDYQMMNESCGNFDNYFNQGSNYGKGYYGQYGVSENNNGSQVAGGPHAQAYCGNALFEYNSYFDTQYFGYQPYNNYCSKTPMTGSKVQNIILQKSGLPCLKENAASELEFQSKKEVTDFSYVFPQPFKLANTQVNVSDFGACSEHQQETAANTEAGASAAANAGTTMITTAEQIEFENSPEQSLAYQVSAFSLNGPYSSTIVGNEVNAQQTTMNSPSSGSIQNKRIAKRKLSARKSTPQMVPMVAPDTNLITLQKQSRAPAPRLNRKKSTTSSVSNASTIIPLTLQGSNEFSETLIGQNVVSLDQFSIQEEIYPVVVAQNSNENNNNNTNNLNDEEEGSQNSSVTSEMSADEQANNNGNIQNENSELSENPEKPKKSSDSKPCNCRNSKCLKRYCDCFAAGIYCNAECKCEECHNKSEYEEERQKAIQKKKKRIKDAFQPVILNNTHIKGCHCKNSHCQKKYCVCHQNGVLCSSLCQCVECENKIAAGYSQNNQNPPQPQNQLRSEEKGNNNILNQFIDNNDVIDMEDENDDDPDDMNRIEQLQLIAESPQKVKNSMKNGDTIDDEYASSNQMEQELLSTIKKNQSSEARQSSIGESEFSTHKKPPSKRRTFKASDKQKALSFFNEVSPAAANHRIDNNPIVDELM